MRQVPQYLIIGDGRVATHFKHYFSILNLSFTSWCRKQPLTALLPKIAESSHILLLINDDAIEPFISNYLAGASAQLIHFSGSLVSRLAYGAHPLMTFSKDLYNANYYPTIPFIVDDDAPDFASLLPGLANPHARLAKSLKEKYHALCVLSGNFSCLLWQKFLTELTNTLHLPASIAYPYLEQQTKNLLANYQSALTGPLARQDFATIQKNLNALEGDPFQAIYQAFVTCYQQTIKQEKSS